MRRVIPSLLLSLLLTACASQPPVSQPPQRNSEDEWGQHWLINRDDDQHWILVLQNEPQGLRFVMFDPLGVPVARQWLVNGRRWKADGLLPPNREARALFNTLRQVLDLPANWQMQPGQRAGPYQFEHRGHIYHITGLETP